MISGTFEELCTVGKFFDSSIFGKSNSNLYVTTIFGKSNPNPRPALIV